MGMGGCYSYLKFFVVFINALFFITGVAITGISTWILVDPTYPVVQDSNNYINGFYVLLIVGILLTIVGLLGCCGACKESQPLLVAFFSLLLVVIVAQIATIIWAYMNVEQLNELFRDNMEKTVNEDYGMKPTDTSAFDVIQRDLKCCGTQGPTDWATSKYGGGEGKNILDFSALRPGQKYTIPSSCCNLPEEDAQCVAGRLAVVGAQVSEIIFSDGCLGKLYDYMEKYRPLLLGISITAGLLELLGLFLSIILCCAVRYIDRYKA